MQPARIRIKSGDRGPWAPARLGPDGFTPGPGKPLPRVLQKILRPFFPDLDLSQVRVHLGIPPELKRASVTGAPAATSWRNHIFIEPGYANLYSPSGWRVLIHELAHVQQWAREGDQMYQRYRNVTEKVGYWDNPYEKEAYHVEGKVIQALTNW